MSPAAAIIPVLLMEGNRDTRQRLAALLHPPAGAARYELTVVSDHASGLLALREHKHAIALVEIRPGEPSGLALLRDAASDPSRPPVIALSGVADSGLDHLAQAAGASDFLVIPDLTPERLDRALRYTLSQHPMRRHLEDSQARYQTIFDASPLAMWLYEPDSLRIVEVNQAAVAQYGYSRTEFLSLTLLDLREADEVPRYLDYARSVAATIGTRNAGIWKHRRKDGSAMYVEVVRSDVRDADRLLRLVIASDISSRLQAEAMLLEREQTLRQVLHDVSDGLMVIDDRGLVQFVNPVLCQHLGRPENELIGTPMRPGLGARDASHVEFVNDSGLPVSLDMRVAETTWNGRRARVITLRDVKDAHARDSRQLLLQRAIESATEGITISVEQAGDHAIIYVNPAFERLTGYAAQEVLGRNCRFLQAEDVDQPEREVIRQALREAKHCVVTLRNYRKDGSLFWNRLTISPVRDGAGQLSHFIGIQSDVTAQTELENERTFLATHDRVTGLPRFDGSEARLEALLTRARSSGGRMALFFVDLDGFNSINGTLGFAIGDSALQVTGSRLRELLGPDAEVTRYAGDQFLLATTDIGSSEDVGLRANAMCEAVSRPMPIAPSVTVYLTASVGAAIYPDNGSTVLELTRQADLATNRAKQNGRNCAFVFTNDMREALADRLALGRRMRDALANDEFILHYQPQVSALDGSVVSLEALVRWDSPELGLLPPSRFIPVAEDNGMILHLGEWILRSACRQLRAWMDAGLSGFAVSVNVSGAQMQRPNFVDEVREVIRTTGIDPSMLELELTEPGLMGNAERSVAQMRALKQLGVRLTLDDFGVGHSGLSYLKRFQLDKLKIDKSFIADIAHDGADAALVRAIISMGHHLGMRVVAVGVESAAQLGYLRRSHCDEFQGFHFSRPLPASQVPELLQHRYVLAASGGPAESTRTLLVLDDEANIRRALVRLLRRDGYQIFDVGTAGEAFDVLASQDVQVVISDQRMPGLSGSEFLAQVKEMYPDTVRMMLSGYTDLATVTDAINQGAIYKFLTKPWEDDELREQVLQAFRRHENQRRGLGRVE